MTLEITRLEIEALIQQRMHSVAPEAEDDLQRIWRHLLGQAGLAVADRIQGELVDTFEGLAKTPGKGP